MHNSLELKLSDSDNTADETLSQIRKLLDNENLKEAEILLNSRNEKDAEWYFLSGMFSYKKGWYDDALSKVN